jgi:hypothetical protein
MIGAKAEGFFQSRKPLSPPRLREIIKRGEIK